MEKLGKQLEDECFILVKAQPHRSSRYYETVCCAGVTRTGQWRRIYPVPFRMLAPDSKFTRWDRITYKYTTPLDDPRRESQKVPPETIVCHEPMKKSERTRLITPLIKESFAEAEANNDSLALLRPSEFTFFWKKKSLARIEIERQKHADLVNQLPLLDAARPKPLEPAPYEFRMKWQSETGTTHQHICDDWESVATFKKWRHDYGETEALARLKSQYEENYQRLGVAFAFSTHSRRNRHFSKRNQWLLVGVVRVNRSDQDDLFFGASS